MSIAKAFTHISVESINDKIITTKLSQTNALDGTNAVATDITIVQPANTILSNITLANSGVTDITPTQTAGDHLEMSIGYNDVGAAKDYTALVTSEMLIRNAGGYNNFWAPHVHLAIITPGVAGQAYPGIFQPDINNSDQLHVSLKEMISTDARELNFRFTPIANPLVTTSTIKVICEFLAL